MPHCVGTLPALLEVSPRHEVRCLLYAPGASGKPAVGPAAVAAVAQPAAARPHAEGVPLLEVRDLRVRFPIRADCCSA